MKPNQVSLLALGLLVKAYNTVRNLVKNPFVMVFAFLAFAGYCFADGPVAFVVYDPATGGLTFNWQTLLTPLLNSAVGALTAAIPILILGMVVRYVLKIFGWMGMRKG